MTSGRLSLVRKCRVTAATLLALLVVQTAQGATPGDVTGDGEVDVSDIQCTVLANLGPTPPGCAAGAKSADLNCDATVDIVDLQLSVLIVLAYPQAWEPPEDLDADGNSVVDACEDTTCGNYVTEGNEECDDGPMGSPCCTVECTHLICWPICGNGEVEEGEDCEPPGEGNCDESCQESLPPVVCGDGQVEEGEDCEPPGVDNCNEWCKWSCCPCQSPCCGDGALDPGEECDDGNDIDGDGCSSVCTLECGCAGIAGTVFCDANPSGNDIVWVFAHSSPITDPLDPFGGEEGMGVDYVSYYDGVSFPKYYEIAVLEAGAYWVWAVHDKGGDGQAGFTEGSDVGGFYPGNPVSVGWGEVTQAINIELDCD